ncbi:hypothetical protein GCM10027598_22970 [Amycolatopsis oliviviridis]|uniref:DUF397 domain-containing protein n=1 Tax=Amycolatopsis oliviviridis TaxID=1471590 RepID=A0ABQ3LKH4_9PSEU|nr:hypothetical protein GCM10017790_30610 [Amycolatopsis oliviviridis]
MPSGSFTRRGSLPKRWSALSGSKTEWVEVVVSGKCRSNVTYHSRPTRPDGFCAFTDSVIATFATGAPEVAERAREGPLSSAQPEKPDLRGQPEKDGGGEPSVPTPSRA